MITNLVKKLFGKKTIKEKKIDKIESKIRKKSKAFSEFLAKRAAYAKEEYFSIKEKLKDLRETNYKLGIKHLENGRFVEAIIRFRLIKKFWPDYFDAYYQLAYCLSLRNNFNGAKYALEDLLDKNPDYGPKAHDLLNHINNSLNKDSSGE